MSVLIQQSTPSLAAGDGGDKAQKLFKDQTSQMITAAVPDFTRGGARPKEAPPGWEQNRRRGLGTGLESQTTGWNICKHQLSHRNMAVVRATAPPPRQTQS